LYLSGFILQKLSLKSSANHSRENTGSWLERELPLPFEITDIVGPGISSATYFKTK
jgi:hypothetical protein